MKQKAETLQKVALVNAVCFSKIYRPTGQLSEDSLLRGVNISQTSPFHASAILLFYTAENYMVSVTSTEMFIQNFVKTDQVAEKLKVRHTNIHRNYDLISLLA
jgi:hypothetical protein